MDDVLTPPPAHLPTRSPEDFLTPHFKYRETWCHPSPGAQQRGFPAAIPLPEEMVREAIGLLKQLEIIRAVWGQPLHIDSFYRTVEYNDWLYLSEGKTPTQSQHCFGRAADIVVVGVPPQIVHDEVLRMQKDGKLKIGGLGRYTTFTHVDTRPFGDHLAQWTGSRASNG